MIEIKNKKLIVALSLVVLWGCFAWFTSERYYVLRAQSLIAQEEGVAQLRAADAADSIRRNLLHLSGVAGYLSQSVSIAGALAQFSTNNFSSNLSFEAKKSRLDRDTRLDALRAQTVRAKSLLNVDIVFVMNAAGDVIAASNYDTAASSVGQNFSDREYLRENRAGRCFDQYAVGRSTHVPGFYFSCPVMVGGIYQGSVVVKIDLPNMSYLLNQSHAFVLDRHGVIVLSANPETELQTFGDASARTLSLAERMGVYGVAKFAEFDAKPLGDDTFASLYRIGVDAVPHVFGSAMLPEYGFTIYVDSRLSGLTDLAKKQKWLFCIAAGSGMLVTFLVFATLLHLRVIKDTNTQLAEREAFLAHILDTSSAAIFILDALGRITHANRSMAEMFGCPLEQLIGTKYLRLVHPAQIELVERRISDLIAGHRDETDADRLYMREDGSEFWGHLRGRRFLGADGRLVGLIGVMFDVTARIESQRESKESLDRLEREAERYAALLKTASDGIHILNENGDLLEASDSFYAMLGYDPSEKPTLTIGDWESRFTPDELRDEVIPSLMRMAQVFETRHRRKDGSVIDVEVNARGVILRGKQYLYASSRDVTVRKQADTILRESEQRFREILEASPIAVRVAVQQGRKVVFINQRYCQMINATPAQVMDVDPRSYYINPKIYDGILQSLEAGEVVTDKLVELRIPGASNIWAMGSYVPMTYAGQAAVLGWFYDVTAIKSANAELARQTKELAAINAELEQFAYVASHDLRQPLRTIASYLEIIEGRLAASIDGELKEYFGFVIGGARRMDHMILDLLEYSRIGRFSDKIEAVPLDGIISECIATLHTAIAESGAEILVQPGLPTVTGERTELIRLFNNLLGNAIKYRHAERQAMIEIGWMPVDKEWHIFVKDNGIGIPEDSIERAFRIFQRLVPPGRYEGSGIGLAICKKIVKQMNGRIWAESKLGEGSTFWIAFPQG